MKREEVIEIAEKSQIDRMPPDYNSRAPYWLATDEELEAFANEVERRTIEKCKQACADVTEPHWTSYECPNTFSDGVVACKDAIDALANQQEKQT